MNLYRYQKNGGLQRISPNILTNQDGYQGSHDKKSANKDTKESETLFTDVEFVDANKYQREALEPDVQQSIDQSYVKIQ